MDLDAHYQMGSLIPLANAANQKLQQEILAKQHILKEWKQRCQENKNNIQALRNEQSGSEQSLHQAHELVRHFRAESQEIEHQEKVQIQQRDWVTREVQLLHKKLSTVNERSQETQGKINKNMKRAAKLEKRLKATEEVRQTWSEAAAAQAKDYNSILEYSKQDEHKIQELELAIHKMRQEEHEAVQELDKLHAERRLLVTELNRLQQDFQQFREDRDQELKQWEANLKQVAARDRELENITNTVNELESQLSQQTNEMDWQESWLSTETKSQVALAAAVKKRERQVAKLQQKQSERLLAFESLQAEVNCAAAFAQKHEAAVAQTRLELKSQKELLSQKQTQLSQTEHSIQKLEKQLEQVQNYSMTSSEQKQQVFQRLQEENDRAKRLQSQLADTAQQKSLQECKLTQLRSSLQNLDTEIQSLQSSLQHNSKSEKNMNELLNQIEDHIYAKNMEWVKLELEFRKLRGEPRSQEEKVAQTNRIRLLSQELEEKRAILVILRQELLTSQSQVARYKHQMEKQKEVQSSLESRAVQLRLESDALERERQLQHQQLEELRLAETLIRLQSENRQKILRTHASQVWGLEKQKIDLQTAMAERKLEIQSRLAVITAECRSLKDKVQHLNMTAKQKWNIVDKIRIRYQVLADTFGAQEEIAPPTEAYLIIKLAQEKESLKEILEDLNLKIEKTEKDNEGLANTLTVVSSSNQQFRQHAIVGVPPPEKQSSQEALEAQKRQIDLELRERIKDLQTIEKGMKLVEEELTNFLPKEAQSKLNLEEEEQNLFLIQKDLNGIKMRHQKTQQLVRKLSHALRTQSSPGLTLEELDFECQLKKEQYQKACEVLHDSLAFQFPKRGSAAEMEARLQSYLITACSATDKSNFGAVLTSSASTEGKDQTGKPKLVKATHLHLPHFHFNPSSPPTPKSTPNQSHRGNHSNSNSLPSSASPRRLQVETTRRISAPAKLKLISKKSAI